MFHLRQVLPGSSPVDPGSSKWGRSWRLGKNYLIRDNKERLGKNSVEEKIEEKKRLYSLVYIESQ